MRLASLLDLAIGADSPDAETAPMKFAMAELSRSPQDLVDQGLLSQVKLQSILRDVQGPAATLGDLLLSPSPSIEAVIAMKSRWKGIRLQKGDRDEEVGATALYYLATVIARVRLRRRVTSLTDKDLRDGLTWLFNQSWLGDPLDRLVDELLLIPHWPDAEA